MLCAEEILDARVKTNTKTMFLVLPYGPPPIVMDSMANEMKPQAKWPQVYSTTQHNFTKTSDTHITLDVKVGLVDISL